MLSGLPSQAEAVFTGLKYVELFRGPYHDARPMLERLENSHLPSSLWKLRVESTPEDPTEVVIAVAAPIEMEARHELDPGVRVPPCAPNLWDQR